jgi:hypothetical protein
LQHNTPFIEKINIIASLCREAEDGWWTWHEALQKKVWVFLVYGMFTSDLMFGNPACGCTSAIGVFIEGNLQCSGNNPCRCCHIHVRELNKAYDLRSNVKTPGFISF